MGINQHRTMCSYHKSNSTCEHRKNVVENKLKSKWLFLRIEIISLVVFLEFNGFFSFIGMNVSKIKEINLFDKVMQNCILRESFIGSICVQYNVPLL